MTKLKQLERQLITSLERVGLASRQAERHTHCDDDHNITDHFDLCLALQMINLESTDKSIKSIH